MALFNTSIPWETNTTGDELCTTFLKDVAGERKNNKKRNAKSVYNLKSIKKAKNELSNVSKSKKKILQKLSKHFDNFHNKFSNGEDKMLINDNRRTTSKNVKKQFNKKTNFNPQENGESKTTQKKSKKEKFIDKMTDSGVFFGNSRINMSKVNSDFEPLLEKGKSKRIEKNKGIGECKTSKKESKKEKLRGKLKESGVSFNMSTIKKSKLNRDFEPSSNGKSKKLGTKLENVKTDLTKTYKKININPRESKQGHSKLNDSGGIKPTNSSILKKRKKQLDKLQNLVLEKQKKDLVQGKQLKKKPNTELSLRQRMIEKLKAARFRFLNEQIYTTTGKETQKVFRSDPNAFKAYHEGYRQQVRNWPLNPLDIVIKSLQRMPKTHLIADFGCGDAILAESVDQQVFSFDLVALNERVTPCDMAHVPLEDSSVDVAVFCLSLMGTNIRDYLLEANRVIKTGGILKIAEVESRFEDVAAFAKRCEQYGFKKTWMDLSHNLFYFLDFKKIKTVKGKERKLPEVTLQPCIYKKR